MTAPITRTAKWAPIVWLVIAAMSFAFAFNNAAQREWSAAWTNLAFCLLDLYIASLLFSLRQWEAFRSSLVAFVTRDGGAA